VRVLGVDPVHGTRETFRALLDAMSRPGTVEAVSEPADHAVVATLVDHEVTLATEDDTLRGALSEQGRLDDGEPTTADIVHARDHTTFDVRDCGRGSLVEPSDGATVVYRVEELADSAEEALTTVSLSGPGVDGETTLSVALPPSELAAIAEAQSSYPRGVDVIFATEDSVASIPRSVSIAVPAEVA